MWKLTKSPKSWKKVISHVSYSQSDSLMADIYSGWENSLISAGFILTAGSKANCAVLMQSHIASRINKTNGLGCRVHNCWSLCSKLHHFIWQSHNANEKYGCSSSATPAASKRWPWGLCFPFIVLHLGTMGETKHFLLSNPFLKWIDRNDVKFPLNSPDKQMAQNSWFLFILE